MGITSNTAVIRNANGELRGNNLLNWYSENIPSNEHTRHGGHVFWITGLSCSGKTTLGRLLFRRLRVFGRPCVHLDGDQLRDAFDNDLGHTFDDRRRSARRYAGLARMFARQDIDVVCSTISLFHDIQSWNRENITNYHEIYLRAPLDVLIARDRKNLYRRALCGEIGNVVGIDLPAEEPERPDMIIDNDGTQAPEVLLDMILEQLGQGRGAIT
jgi:adenylylsulfate kinase-like enzyme